MTARIAAARGPAGGCARRAGAAPRRELAAAERHSRRTTRASARSEADWFAMPAAPILLPEGDWRVVPGSVTAPRGFKAAGMHSGMRAGTKADLALVTCEGGAVTAGVYTQNVMCAAPVIVTRRALESSSGAIRAVRSRSSPLHRRQDPGSHVEMHVALVSGITPIPAPPPRYLVHNAETHTPTFQGGFPVNILVILP